MAKSIQDGDSGGDGNLLEEVKKAILERLGNPFFGTAAVFWIILHWRVLIVLFYWKGNAGDRIEGMEQHIGGWGGIVGAGLIAFVYQSLFSPSINSLVKIVNRRVSWQFELWAHKAESKRMEFRELRIADRKLELAQETAKLVKVRREIHDCYQSLAVATGLADKGKDYNLVKQFIFKYERTPQDLPSLPELKAMLTICKECEKYMPKIVDELRKKGWSDAHPDGLQDELM